MGRLTTHVLDTMNGRPAAGMSVSLWRLLPGQPPEAVCSLQLNADGRADAPLLQGDAFVPGQYRLVFGVAAYFRGLGVTLPEPPFLDEVPLEFGLAAGPANAEQAPHYHVPLLVSPWAYSTYRGS